MSMNQLAARRYEATNGRIVQVQPENDNNLRQQDAIAREPHGPVGVVRPANLVQEIFTLL